MSRKEIENIATCRDKLSLPAYTCWFPLNLRHRRCPVSYVTRLAGGAESRSVHPLQPAHHLVHTLVNQRKALSVSVSLEISDASQAAYSPILPREAALSKILWNGPHSWNEGMVWKHYHSFLLLLFFWGRRGKEVSTFLTGDFSEVAWLVCV